MKPAWGRLLHKTTLGKHFNEGARLLWATMATRSLSPINVAKMLNESRDISNLVSRWLYGERRPCLQSAARIQAVFGINASAWVMAPTCAFVLPTIEWATQELSND